MTMRILLFLIISTMVVAAQPRWTNRGDARGEKWRGGKMIRKLDLNDEQKKQFKNLRTDMQKDRIAIRAKVQSTQLDLRELLRAEKPNRGAIESKLSEISKLKNDTKLRRIAFWFDVNKLLNPDQQKVWKKALLKRPEGRKKFESSHIRGRRFGMKHGRFKRR